MGAGLGGDTVNALANMWRRADDWLMVHSARVGGWVLACLGIAVLLDGYRWGVAFAVHTLLVIVLAQAVVLLGFYDPPKR